MANDSVKKENSDQVEDSRFAWYVVRAATGFEQKAVLLLNELIQSHKLEKRILEVAVPSEEVVEIRGGSKRRSKRKFFPGYVLIKMVMSDRTWHLVKDTEKIMGFVGGTSDKPAPITDEEAAYMTSQAEDGAKHQRTSVSFSEGDSVKVTEGPFASFVGTVEAVSEKGKVKVNVSIFGRPTPVELDFSQVEKVS